MAEKEYIERGALLERLKFKRDKSPDLDGRKRCGLDSAIAQVRKAPSADVVEVVRCKDCKYWKQVTAERHACCMIGFEMDYDEYCSYGERKE